MILRWISCVLVFRTFIKTSALLELDMNSVICALATVFFLSVVSVDWSDWTLIKTFCKSLLPVALYFASSLLRWTLENTNAEKPRALGLCLFFLSRFNFYASVRPDVCLVFLLISCCFQFKVFELYQDKSMFRFLQNKKVVNIQGNIYSLQWQYKYMVLSLIILYSHLSSVTPLFCSGSWCTLNTEQDTRHTQSQAHSHLGSI